MNVKRVYILTLLASAVLLAGIYAVSEFSAEELAVPVISYASDDIFYDEAESQTAYSGCLIDLNSADVQTLTEIEGIGAETAEKIVAYAAEYGFNSVDELIYVSGIGEKKLEAIRPYVTVTNSASETKESISSTEHTAAEEKKIQFPLDLNTASKEELMEINGVGEVIAERICEYARSVGFSSVDELINVKGIGKHKLESIRPYVTVTEPVKKFDTSAENVTKGVTQTEASNKEVQFPLNLNTAAKEELMQIDGIGEVLAERITEYARTEGFSSVDELLNVKGIGEKKLEAMLPYVCV